MAVLQAWIRGNSSLKRSSSLLSRPTPSLLPLQYLHMLRLPRPTSTRRDQGCRRLPVLGVAPRKCRPCQAPVIESPLHSPMHNQEQVRKCELQISLARECTSKLRTVGHRGTHVGQDKHTSCTILEPTTQPSANVLNSFRLRVAWLKVTQANRLCLQLVPVRMLVVSYPRATSM